MTITLLGKTYSTVLDAAGRTVVIVQQTKTLWRVASVQDAARVMRGLLLSPVAVS